MKIRWLFSCFNPRLITRPRDPPDLPHFLSTTTSPSLYCHHHQQNTRRTTQHFRRGEFSSRTWWESTAVVTEGRWNQSWPKNARPRTSRTTRRASMKSSTGRRSRWTPSGSCKHRAKKNSCTKLLTLNNKSTWAGKSHRVLLSYRDRRYGGCTTVVVWVAPWVVHTTTATTAPFYH